MSDKKGILIVPANKNGDTLLNVLSIFLRKDLNQVQQEERHCQRFIQSLRGEEREEAEDVHGQVFRKVGRKHERLHQEAGSGRDRNYRIIAGVAREESV